ncbi:deoxycytidine monophosphate deaminase [Saccharomycopsis crataegensis]|uniref:Deoxycytidylate deaminase n=1 Tax=Saccharomycopsis crataegensis TaxID=43959 RepID=A0AAV5QUT7_9ASCO|nr:deoxycytidine monophosphate deaminase [Saccharomycopsis crataegensis]
MLIGVSGTIFSGKQEIVRYLSYQGFSYVSLDDPNNKNFSSLPPGIKQKPSPSDIFPEVTFHSVSELLEYVTKNWEENIVVMPVNNYSVVEELSVRPFFLHLIVDGSSKIRYQRFKKKCSKIEISPESSSITLCETNNTEYPPLSFEDFVELSEQNINFFAQSHSTTTYTPTVKVINNTTTVKDLYVQLSSLNIFDPLRLRPNWDTYFMKLANLAALRSNCMKRRVGCVIVKDNRVIATGYNGTPRHLKNCNQGGCKRCNNTSSGGEALSTCLCLHAEENALLESGRDRVTSDHGSKCILYCNTCPCLTCSIKIIQCGISEVVYSQSYSMDSSSKKILNEAGIGLRQFSPPKDVITT